MAEKNVDHIIASALKRKVPGDDELVESLASFEVEIEESVKLSVALTFPSGFLVFFNGQSSTRVQTSNGTIKVCRNCFSGGRFDGDSLHLATTASNSHTLALTKREHLETLIEVLAIAKKDWLAAGAPGAVTSSAKFLTI